MSWLGRLFGGRAQPAPPPAHSVIVDEALAAQLTAGGLALDAAVESALRAYLDAQAKAAEAGEPERIPFWLRRDDERSDMDEELRDRVIQRQSGGDDDVETQGKRAPGKQMEIGGT